MDKGWRQNLHCKQPIVVDLFAGAGGTGLGFQQAGFRIVAAVEIDPYAAATYERNLGISVTREDISLLLPVVFREQLSLVQGELDVLMGGPPCQGFSKMRNGNGHGDARNGLVLRYLEYVAEFRPKYALMENVPGLVRSGHGREVFEALLSGLKGLGYRAEERLIDAVDYGVPQHRKRIIVVAARDGLRPPFPEPKYGTPGSLEVQAGLLKSWRTVRDAIAAYPPVTREDGRRFCAEYLNHYAAAASDEMIRFLSAVPKDGGSRKDLPRSMWLKCHTEHEGHADVYGRAAWDRPSNTMTTGCTNPSKGRFVHPEQNRAFTPREAAALQGFPDDFVFEDINVGRQIGNAVPPPLARAFAECILETLGTGYHEQVAFERQPALLDL